MSELEPDNFLKDLSPDSALQLAVFDAKRHELYDWMNSQAFRMPHYGDIESDVVNRLHEVAGAFAESSLVIRRHIPDLAIAGRFIGQNWINDETERLRIIRAITPGIGMDQGDSTYIRNAVDFALTQQRDDDEVSDNLRQCYHEGLRIDVISFFNGLLAYKQAMTECGEEVHVPDGLGAVRHFEVHANYHWWMAKHYGKTALRQFI